MANTITRRTWHTFENTYQQATKYTNSLLFDGDSQRCSRAIFDNLVIAKDAKDLMRKMRDNKVHTLEQLFVILGHNLNVDEDQHRKLLYFIFETYANEFREESENFFESLIASALGYSNKTFNIATAEGFLHQRDHDYKVEYLGLSTKIIEQKRVFIAKLQTLFTQEHIKDFLENCPELARNLSSEFLHDLAMQFEPAARVILSNAHLSQQVEVDAYERFRIYNAHSSSLWLAKQVLTQLTLKKVQGDHEWATKPDNWQKIEGLQAKVSEILASKRESEIECEYYKLQKHMVEQHAKLSIEKNRFQASNQKEELILVNRELAKLEVYLADLRHKTGINDDDNLDVETYLLPEDLKKVVGKFNGLTQAKNKIDAEIDRLSKEIKQLQKQYDGTLETLVALSKQTILPVAFLQGKQGQTEAQKKEALYYFLKTGTKGIADEQAWQNIKDLISFAPDFASLIGKEHVEAMFALADDPAKFKAVFEYLLQYNKPALSDSRILSAAAKNKTNDDELHNKAVKNIQTQIYTNKAIYPQEKSFFEKHNGLLGQLYNEDNDHLVDLLNAKFLNGTYLIQQPTVFLKTQLAWLKTSNQFMHIIPTLNQRMANDKKELRKFWHYKPGWFSKESRPIDQLRYVVNTAITNYNPAEHQHNKLLLSLLQDRQTRGLLNLDAKAVKDWIKNSDYDPDVCKVIANDRGLMDKLQNEIPDCCPMVGGTRKGFYIEASHFLNQLIKLQTKWGEGRRRQAVIDCILSYPATKDQSEYALIASNDRYWKHAVNYINKSWFTKNRRQRKEAVIKLSPFFKAKLENCSILDIALQDPDYFREFLNEPGAEALKHEVLASAKNEETLLKLRSYYPQFKDAINNILSAQQRIPSPSAELISTVSLFSARPGNKDGNKYEVNPSTGYKP